MDFCFLRHNQCVARAIYPDTYSSRTFGHDVRILRHLVIRTIDMQADAQGHEAIGIGKIVCAISVAREISLIVDDSAVVAINRPAIKGLAVNRIPQVLHNGQFYFQKRCVIGIGTMTHHASRLQM